MTAGTGSSQTATLIWISGRKWMDKWINRLLTDISMFYILNSWEMMKIIVTFSPIRNNFLLILLKKQLNTIWGTEWTSHLKISPILFILDTLYDFIYLFILTQKVERSKQSVITKQSVLIPSSIFFAEAGRNKSKAFRGFFFIPLCLLHL